MRIVGPGLRKLAQLSGARWCTRPCCLQDVSKSVSVQWARIPVRRGRGRLDHALDAFSRHAEVAQRTLCTKAACQTVKSLHGVGLAESACGTCHLVRRSWKIVSHCVR